MSEKRFIIVKSIENFYSLVDKEREDKEQILLLSLHKEQVCTVCDLLNEQQATINELQSIINHIKCEENCEDYDYCCETVCSLYNEIKHLKEENEQLRLELETHKHPLWSTREAEKKVNKLADSLANEVKKNGLLNEEINQLRIENMRLKKKGGDSI